MGGKANSFKDSKKWKNRNIFNIKFSTIVKICFKLDFEHEVGLHMMSKSTGNNFYPLIADSKSIFRPLSIFKLKKPKKCPYL